MKTMIPDARVDRLFECNWARIGVARPHQLRPRKILLFQLPQEPVDARTVLSAQSRRQRAYQGNVFAQLLQFVDSASDVR
jgi:hypothetical protein